MNCYSVVQILVKLCSHAAPAEELARRDDLTLLFSAITSWCPKHNIPWRKSAAEVLMTLSRHGLTPNVVQYIHSTSKLPCAFKYLLAMHGYAHYYVFVCLSIYGFNFSTQHYFKFVVLCTIYEYFVCCNFTGIV